MVTSVSYSPTGRYLASGSYDGTVQVWDLSNSLIEGLRRNVYQMPSGGVYHLSSDQLLPLYVLHQFHLEQSELGKKLPQERPKPIMLSGIQHALELKFGPTIPWIVNLTASYRLLPP
jgi:WD40 repeat protein